MAPVPYNGLTPLQVLPGLTIQNMFDFILLFTELQQEEAILTEDILKVINLLGVSVFQPLEVFRRSYQPLIRRQELEVRNKPEQEDPFAPGYSVSKHQVTSKSAVFKEETLHAAPDHPKTADHQDDPDFDDFIDDIEMESEEEFWGDNEYNPAAKIKKAKIPKTSGSSKSTQESSECVEVILRESQKAQEPCPSLDHVVAPWLRCHQCHQVQKSNVNIHFHDQ